MGKTTRGRPPKASVVNKFTVDASTGISHAKTQNRRSDANHKTARASAVSVRVRAVQQGGQRVAVANRQTAASGRSDSGPGSSGAALGAEERAGTGTGR